MSVIVFVCIIWSKRENETGFATNLTCAVPRIDFISKIMSTTVIVCKIWSKRENETGFDTNFTVL